jgi:hypothetical protein
MNHPPDILQEMVEVLVRSFGATRVKSAVTEVEREQLRCSLSPAQIKPIVNRRSSSRSISVAAIFNQLQRTEPDKHALLSEFYGKLMDGKLLVEAQDVRIFGQAVGIKRFAGRSRRDLISELIRFMVVQSSDSIKESLREVGSISEARRQQGYSVLTEKLLAHP